MFVPNHLHFIARAHVNDPPRSSTDLNDWLRELVGLVDMQVVAGPTSVYVDEPGNEGVTGTITLATSHAAVHVWDASRPSLVQFDIYSCKEYDIRTVIAHLDLWKISSIEWILLDRNTGINVQAGGKDHRDE